MRKSFDGLCGLVRSGLNRDPLSGEVFVFTFSSTGSERTSSLVFHTATCWVYGAGLVLFAIMRLFCDTRRGSVHSKGASTNDKSARVDRACQSSCPYGTRTDPQRGSQFSGSRVAFLADFGALPLAAVDYAQAQPYASKALAGEGSSSPGNSPPGPHG